MERKRIKINKGQQESQILQGKNKMLKYLNLKCHLEYPEIFMELSLNMNEPNAFPILPTLSWQSVKFNFNANSYADFNYQV